MGILRLDWKPVTGFPKLEATSCGKLRWNKNRPRKQRRSRLGYRYILVYGGSAEKRIEVRTHRAVALAHVANPTGLREVNHIDGDKLNNSAANLEWCTRSHNMRHAFRLGLRKCATRKLNAKQVKRIKQMLAAGRTAYWIAPQFGVAVSTIHEIRKGKNWRSVS